MTDSKQMDDFQGDDAPVLSFKRCPAEGSGVHKWLMGAAFRCLDAGLSAEQAAHLIRSKMTRPENACDEVSNTLKEAARRMGAGEILIGSGMKWPERDEKAMAALPREPRPIATPITATQAIDALFPGNPFLCIAASSTSKPFSVLRCDYEALENAQLMVPSPMLGPKGYVKSKEYKSARGIHNVGRRKYIVIECDFSPADKDLCWAVLQHMATKRPLLCVVDSGGKSLHGWYPVDPAEDDDGGNLLGFMQEAVRMGGDDATWRKNQYVRVPGGLRMPGAVRQEIIYWNQERIEKWAAKI